VVQKGEFVFAAAALDHGHITGMVKGLLDAGGVVRYVYDPDPAKVKNFVAMYPEAIPVPSLDVILDDKDVQMVAAAAVPCDRGPLGIRVMDAGKDYFTDKTPFTSMDQLEAAKIKTAATGKKYMVYYSERLHSEVDTVAASIVTDGTIGRVIQVLGMGPHRLNVASRPDWFFRKAQYGGILCDIGSHQIEQFLFYAGAKDARVTSARVANYNNPDHPELEDFGDASLVGDNGAAHYFRVDWFTPDGLGTWGDGRLFILGTKGYMELRKYTNVGVETAGNHLVLVTQDKEEIIHTEGTVGFPFFGQLILDCLNRTEKAMTQAHAFKAAELCLDAQAKAEKIH